MQKINKSEIEKYGENEWKHREMEKLLFLRIFF